MRILGNHKVLGIAFLALLVFGVYATYAVFTKKFVDYEEVRLETSSIGLQLPSRADVKIRGVIVGEVLETQTRADGAELTLGIFPEKMDTIPANVTGSIVPKTLFGEKYVSLEIPESGPEGRLRTDAVIDRTAVSTEVEQVLSDLYPLLRAVQPAELNMTLNAVATALEGRGELIGENLETVDAYLKRLNPQIPGLVEDLRLTAQVSDVYSDVLPEVAQILEDTVTTTGTLEDRAPQLNALFTEVASFSDTARGFLAENGDNITRLADVGSQQLRVLAKYAKVFPCLTAGIVKAGKLQAEAFRGFTLHIVLETLPRQPRAYGPQDKPRIAEDRGPDCLNLPNPPWSQANPLRNQPNLDDGVDEPTGKGTSRVSPGYFFDGAGEPGSVEESDLLKELIGPGFGVPASEVSDLSVLLVAPMARGAEVSLR
ncbi:MCE family protein [Nocardioides sp. cx-173]|uniref:MCE family protein n=1 Tax=Nocardioides sp. cx-173 TaxID=2898796 RepID=UPI001E544007|nr:MCE family protein [Nocardioides sp. cx-173]MCD4524006.1 MCE family protein [Nocardioides sp. cx-173]UGB41407.1 MCE family protein [Nocardioides sp. cx-173]